MIVVLNLFDIIPGREKQYAQFFPDEWMEGGVEALVALDPVAEVKRFFSERSPARGH